MSGSLSPISDSSSSSSPSAGDSDSDSDSLRQPTPTKDDAPVLSLGEFHSQEFSQTSLGSYTDLGHALKEQQIAQRQPRHSNLGGVEDILAESCGSQSPDMMVSSSSSSSIPRGVPPLQGHGRRRASQSPLRDAFPPSGGSTSFSRALYSEVSSQESPQHKRQNTGFSMFSHRFGESMDYDEPVKRSGEDEKMSPSLVPAPTPSGSQAAADLRTTSSSSMNFCLDLCTPTVDLSCAALFPSGGVSAPALAGAKASPESLDTEDLQSSQNLLSLSQSPRLGSSVERRSAFTSLLERGCDRPSVTDDEKGKVSGHTLEGYQLAGGHQEDRGTNRGQDSKTSSGRARVAHGKKSSRSRLSKVLSKEDTGEAGTASETVAPPKAKRGRPKGSGTKIKRTYAQGAPQPEKTAKTKYVFKSNSNCRKDKSLTTLTARFLGHFELQEKKDVWIDQASADLMVERRRMYDVVNVLNAIEVVTKVAKNHYAYVGVENLVDTMEKLRDEASRFTEGELSGGRDPLRMRGTAIPEVEDEPSTSQQSVDSLTLLSEAAAHETLLNSGKKGKRGKKKQKKNQSLTVLSRRFVQLFLVLNRKVISLDEVARRLLGEEALQGSPKAQSTKTRRLYDIANVFAALRIIEKTPLSEELRKPAFRFLFDRNNLQSALELADASLEKQISQCRQESEDSDGDGNGSGSSSSSNDSEDESGSGGARGSGRGRGGYEEGSSTSSKGSQRSSVSKSKSQSPAKGSPGADKEETLASSARIEVSTASGVHKEERASQSSSCVVAVTKITDSRIDTLSKETIRVPISDILSSTSGGWTCLSEPSLSQSSFPELCSQDSWPSRPPFSQRSLSSESGITIRFTPMGMDPLCSSQSATTTTIASSTGKAPGPRPSSLSTALLEDEVLCDFDDSSSEADDTEPPFSAVHGQATSPPYQDPVPHPLTSPKCAAVTSPDQRSHLSPSHTLLQVTPDSSQRRGRVPQPMEEDSPMPSRVFKTAASPHRMVTHHL